jgi:enoyl-CoA hydratase/carnithine racemase
VTEFEAINVDVDGGVAVVTLDRPERLNAWTARMGRELSAAFRALDGDPEVRVIVLTGAGRAFCAGADLGAGSATFDSDRPADREATEPLVLPWQLRKPVIAAINGHAIGVGITLPLTADVRYIAEDAKVQFAFVRRGVVPELSSHVILPRVVGLSNAADLLLSGRIFTGRQAAERGLATAALPAADVLPAAMEWRPTWPRTSRRPRRPWPSVCSGTTSSGPSSEWDGWRTRCSRGLGTRPTPRRV